MSRAYALVTYERVRALLQPPVQPGAEHDVIRALTDCPRCPSQVATWCEGLGAGELHPERIEAFVGHVLPQLQAVPAPGARLSRSHPTPRGGRCIELLEPVQSQGGARIGWRCPKCRASFRADDPSVAGAIAWSANEFGQGAA